jgi:hypothetical protein
VTTLVHHRTKAELALQVLRQRADLVTRIRRIWLSISD